MKECLFISTIPDSKMVTINSIYKTCQDVCFTIGLRALRTDRSSCVHDNFYHVDFELICVNLYFNHKGFISSRVSFKVVKLSKSVKHVNLGI